MKKKLLCAVLAVSMIAAMCMTGCGSSSSSSSASKSSSSASSSTAASSAKSSGSDSSSVKITSSVPKSELFDSKADYTKLKVGALATLVKDDGGWCQAQYKGLVNAMKACGMDTDTQLVFMENITEEPTAVSNAVEALSKQGCNIIVGASTGYAPILADMVDEYPSILFAQVGAPTEGLLGYQMRDYQAMFLCGYICGLMSDTSNLGYSAGMSEASVRRGINAFALGAKYAKSDATVRVVWANSWYDTTAEAECANSLISSGIKYLGINASSPAIPQACEKAGAYCTGYHQDMHDYAPNAVLVSYIWNWAPIFEKVFTEFATNGNKPYTDYYFWGSDMDCPQISDMNSALVPADIQQKVKDVQQQIIDGKIDVYAGELKDNEGNVLVKSGETMSDMDIITQEFLVDNVIGTWK